MEAVASGVSSVECFTGGVGCSVDVVGFVLEASDAGESLVVSVYGGSFPQVLSAVSVAGCLAAHRQVRQSLGESVFGRGPRVMLCLVEQGRILPHHG